MDEKDLIIQELKRKLRSYEDGCSSCEHINHTADEQPCVECYHNYDSRFEEHQSFECNGDSCGIDWGDDNE